MTNLTVKVFNRPRARAESVFTQPNPFAIISISTPFDSMNRFSHNPQCKEILHLVFDDIEDAREGGLLMTEDDAKKVAEFCVRNIKRGVREFWVHCDAGISRSAGVAAAILKYFTGDDTQIYDNPRYAPNSHCYRMVLNAFDGFCQATNCVFFSMKTGKCVIPSGNNRNLYDDGGDFCCLSFITDIKDVDPEAIKKYGLKG